jgi:hypothetical protein
MERMEDARPRRGLLALAAIVPVFVAAALWLPRWWENREYREAEAIAGVGAPIGPGTLAEARKELDPGAAAADVVARLGKPSISVATEGRDSRREVWTYYFADGTMRVNLTDGRVQRVSTTFGSPKIPTSARPE